MGSLVPRPRKEANGMQASSNFVCCGLAHIYSYLLLNRTAWLPLWLQSDCDTKINISTTGAVVVIFLVDVIRWWVVLCIPMYMETQGRCILFSACWSQSLHVLVVHLSYSEPFGWRGGSISPVLHEYYTKPFVTYDFIRESSSKEYQSLLHYPWF